MIAELLRVRRCVEVRRKASQKVMVVEPSSMIEAINKRGAKPPLRSTSLSGRPPPGHQRLRHSRLATSLPSVHSRCELRWRLSLTEVFGLPICRPSALAMPLRTRSRIRSLSNSPIAPIICRQSLNAPSCCRAAAFQRSRPWSVFEQQMKRHCGWMSRVSPLSVTLR